MSGRTAAHQLSNGMLVSRPLPTSPRERPAPSSCAAPYTGSDFNKSGEFGRMFNIPAADSTVALSSSSRCSSWNRSPSPRSYPSSFRFSPVPATGLITSGPVRGSSRSHTPIASSRAGRNESAVTEIQDEGFAFGASRAWGWARWLLAVVLAVGIAAGALVWVVLGRMEILVGVATVTGVVAAVAAWNRVMRGTEVERLLRRHPNSLIDPRNLPIGEVVKITGHVTCGSIPLETSYRKISRCIYASTELYEHRARSGFPANPKHKWFTWGLRNSQRHVADFYISDSTTGMRFLVRAGNGAKVTSFVNSAIVMEMHKKNNNDLSLDFLSWLTEHNLSSDDHRMRLKEGYIKEGSTASVMGVLRMNENLLMIDPSYDFSTGCQWSSCLFPLFVQGLILIGDESTDEMVYQV
ncbi:hypothetical protein Cni_G27897 [Canna indica]|uniref:Uncharacterized protein n=1 Tax=Canna indica TaxID=4628 RepID=A0AAQ3L2T4_9LILI|nr:hypothetical protein Cni_G27897 [Canna indica]